MPPTVYHLRVSALCFPVLKKAAGGVGPARVNCRVSYFDMLDGAVLVDDEGGAVRKALLFVQDPVFFGNRPLEVAQEREVELFLLRESGIRCRAVNADAQDLRVGLLEFGDISLIRLQLLRSTPGEGQNVKCQHHILLPQKIAQLHILPVGVLEREVRRLVTHFERGGTRRPREAQGEQEDYRNDAQSVQH